jgi:hypothetical protein
MQFATLKEAFGVDSLENGGARAGTRKKFEDVPGEDVHDVETKDIEPPITVIPEDRKITKREVQEFIANTYRKGGMPAVWNMLDSRVQERILWSCKQSAGNVRGFFEDLFASPEKLLALLAVLFVVIILLDTSQGKKDMPKTQGCYYPQMHMPQMQAPQMQVPQMQMPQMYTVNPINLG